MSRNFPVAALAAACLVAFGFSNSTQAEPTTVKSSKSNSSERMGGGGGHGRSAKVKISKSNNSERMGGGGGVSHGPAGVINLNSSRSNKY
jgi:hypothetical protein